MRADGLTVTDGDHRALDHLDLAISSSGVHGLLAVRALIHGGQLAGPLIQSVAWMLALLALWSALATRSFARTS